MEVEETDELQLGLNCADVVAPGWIVAALASEPTSGMVSVLLPFAAVVVVVEVAVVVATAYLVAGSAELVAAQA